MTLTPVLSLSGLTRRFGGIHAVSGVSFDLAPAAVTAVIGPNGAGKTTLINLITGVLSLNDGSIRLEGADVTAEPAHRRAKAGIARTYQTPQMGGGMSVLRNVMAGAYRFGRHGLVSTVLRPWVVMAENEEMAERAVACLRRVAVPESWWNRPAIDLPYGLQRRVEIARALAQDPKVILLDEPAAGLNPSETSDLARLLSEIAADGRAVLLVEHDMPMVMSISSHLVVINFGRKLAEGTPAEISGNPEVIAAYLGSDEEAA
jgi:branched-chain amino acid transport system ATP-binding protein